MPAFDSTTLTWTALLGRWMEYARAAMAEPDDADGRRWRAAVPHVITLQAVAFALREVGDLPADERALGRDRAAILIREAESALLDAWPDDTLPHQLGELIDDACAALDAAAFASAVELCWEGPGELVMPVLHEVELMADTSGSLAVMQGGTIVMPGEPVAWWIDRPALRVAGCVEHRPPTPHQVYRQFDEQRRITGDVIAPVHTEPPEGLPLLVPLLHEGRRIGHFTLDAEDWHAHQRNAMDGEMIPVMHLESSERS